MQQRVREKVEGEEWSECGGETRDCMNCLDQGAARDAKGSQRQTHGAHRAARFPLAPFGSCAVTSIHEVEVDESGRIRYGRLSVLPLL